MVSLGGEFYDTIIKESLASSDKCNAYGVGDKKKIDWNCVTSLMVDLVEQLSNFPLKDYLSRCN